MQIAGDQLDESLGYDRFAALGYFGLGAVYYKNSDKEKAQADELDDRIDTLTRGFLGLTVSCARCHDHKFDPIPTADYYSLAGIFSSSPLANVPMVEQDVVAAYNRGQQAVKQAEKDLTDRTSELRETVADAQTSRIAEYILAIWKQRVAAVQKKPLSNKQLAKDHDLSEPAIKLWGDFLGDRQRGKHPAFAPWYKFAPPTAETSIETPPAEVQQFATAVQAQIQSILEERAGKKPKPKPEQPATPSPG